MRAWVMCGLLLLAPARAAFAQAPSPVAEELRKALEVQAPVLERSPSFPDASTDVQHTAAPDVRSKTHSLRAALTPSFKNRIHAAAIGVLRSYIKHISEGHGGGEGAGMHGGPGGEHHEHGDHGEHGERGPTMPRPPHHEGHDGGGHGH